ncbi:MAG TPA: uroporphyrinogen decarboxylase family protein [Victivallales bacterium]|nr:uroporphyrinogen decarboxylase family protein [Victivallales bacterium]
MNSYERYINVLQNKPVDFIPRVPILMLFAAEYINSDYEFLSKDFNVLVEANRKCAEDFGFEQLSCICDSAREMHGLGAEVTYHKNLPPTAYRILEESRDISQLQKADPYKSERMLDIVNACDLYSRKFKKQYSILGWVEGPACLAAELRGMCNYMMDTFDDESYVCDLMDICLNTAIDFAKAQCKAGCDTIGVGDAVVSQLSPDLYERIILPREKILIDEIHDAGAYVKLHICGNITNHLDAISDLDIDIIDIDHMVNIKNVRDKLKNKVAITGNLDPVADIMNGTPDKIRDSFKRIYDLVGNPYMVNAGCEIPSGTPIENLKALCSPITYQK